MTIGDIKLSPLKTSTEKIEFFKDAKNNTFNSIMESLTKNSSEEDDWRNMSDKEWDRLVKRVDDSTGIGEINVLKLLSNLTHFFRYVPICICSIEKVAHVCYFHDINDT